MKFYLLAAVLLGALAFIVWHSRQIEWKEWKEDTIYEMKLTEEIQKRNPPTS